jgi:hypothetical protein
MALLLDTLVRPSHLAERGFVMTRPAWPYLERYEYTWIQHPDSLYYGPPYPEDDEALVRLEERGILGHRAVRRGEYRYFLRSPEVDDA